MCHLATLCRNELSPAERAIQTARRKAIYEELYPEAKAQVRQGHIRQGAADENIAPAFTTSTAAATGQSERIVQLNAERGTKVIAEVIDLITGTKLDTGTYLDKEQPTRTLRPRSPTQQQSTLDANAVHVDSTCSHVPANLSNRSRYPRRYPQGVCSNLSDD